MSSYLVISSICHQLTMQASIPMARLGCQSTHLVWTEIDWTIDIVSGLWSVLHARQGWEKQRSNATISRKSWIFHVCVPSEEWPQCTMNTRFGFINLPSIIHTSFYLDSKPQSGLNECIIGCSGGLLYWQKWNNMHFVTSASFLLIVYSDYLTSAGKQLQCPSGEVDPSQLLALAKSQV